MLDDDSRHIISWRLTTTMAASDVTATLEEALEATGLTEAHPMTQGKIERYHLSMKNVVKLEHHYFPWELENAIAQWVAHYDRLTDNNAIKVLNA